jgi:hypothetical protein
MSSTATSGKLSANGRRVRGSIDAGLDDPNGLPIEFTQITK